MKKRFQKLCVLFLAVLCVGGLIGMTSVAKAEETSLQWVQKPTKVKAGKKVQFTVNETGAVTWTISNTKYASVDENGCVTGKRVGKVVLTAQAGEEKIQTTIRVKGKKKIALDAGHQLRGDSRTEPVGPGASTRKARVAGGATGVASGVPEYKFTLSVAKKLKAELLNRGYEVYMVRSKNNVNISNKKRAQLANKSGSDIYIRIHGDSIGSSSVRGASAFYPSTRNPYVSRLSKSSKRLTNKVLNAYCKKTGIRKKGSSARDDLTGTNWSKIPVTLIECGFLSNPTEDRKMQNSAFQKKMAKGIANGIDAYFR